MKKYYISPITDGVILPMGNILVGSDGEGTFTPPGMPNPGAAPARSGAMRNTLIKA